MPERLSDLEAALLKLQPASVPHGPVLIEMGRAAAERSMRRWRAFSLLATTAAAALAMVIAFRPEPAGRVQVVYVPAAPAVSDIGNNTYDAVDAVGPSFSGLPLRQQFIGVDLEPFPDDMADEPIPRPLRAGDVDAFTNSGGR